MGVKEDVRAVFRELSPILAGFKLALIVISYFGIGSVAKWVVSHWYPFTRWVWDRFCEVFTFPTLPVVLKDSLTALIFFVPLGTTAIIEFRRGGEESRSIHRILGAFFGVLFLVIICKDAFSEIGEALRVAAVSSNFNDEFMLRIREALDVVNSIPRAIFFAFLGVYLVSAGALAVFINRSSERRAWFERHVRKSFRYSAFGFASGTLFPVFYLFFSTADDGTRGVGLAVAASIAIMFLILSILLVAVAFAPRRLFIATGACVAFVFTAVCFELVVALIHFIEKKSA